MSKETFCVGDVVDWDGEINDNRIFPEIEMTHSEKVKKYGAGPFKITKVINVPENVCSCGMALYDHTKYYSLELLEMVGPHHAPHCCPKGCSKTMRESVGHHQWVEIGEIISPLNGCPERWSGTWFKKVKPNTDATPQKI